MRSAALAAVAFALLAGCRRPASAHPPGAVPASGVPPAVPAAIGRLAPGALLQAPEERIAKARALFGELRDALARDDRERAQALVSGGDLLSSVGRDLVARLSDREVRIRFEPLCPAGEGLYVRFVAMEALFSAGGHEAAEVYAGPDAGGAWRFFPAGPRDAIRARLVSEVARVRVDPAKGTIAGEASLTVDPGGERWVPIALDVAAPDPEEAWEPEPGGFMLTALEVEGAPARFQVVPGAGVIVVELPAAVAPVTARLAWAGTPRPRINYVNAREVLLHEAQPWLPLVGAGAALADLDLTVEHPEPFEMVLEEDPRPVKTAPGWVARRSRVRSDAGTTIFGRPAYAKRRLALGGLRVLLAVAPDRAAAEIDDLEEGIRALHHALSVLGEPPARHLRVVESTPPAAIAAVGGRSFIALGSDAMKRTIVAHELGHSWFGGLIPGSQTGEWGGQWPESLAEFAVTWAIDEARARALRAEWADCYAPVFGGEEPLKVTRNAPATAARPVLYCKGPLLLAALERRAGRPALQAALARFVRERANRASTWEDVVAAVRAEAGEADADWLSTMLERTGAPTFELEGIAVKDGVFRGTLRQRRPDFSVPDIREEVELVFFDGEGKPLGPPAVIPLPVRATPVSLPVPAGAVAVEIDPEHRYPWKRRRGLGTARYPLVTP